MVSNLFKIQLKKLFHFLNYIKRKMNKIVFNSNVIKI